MEHDTLRILGRTGEPMPWILVRGEQRWEGIPPGRATANSPDLLMRMALEGVGIAVINDHFALPYLQRGELVEVLPDWQMPSVNAWAVFPGRRLMPARTRVFLDALAAKFTGPDCQGIEADVKKAKARSRRDDVSRRVPNARLARGLQRTRRGGGHDDRATPQNELDRREFIRRASAAAVVGLARPMCGASGPTTRWS